MNRYLIRRATDDFSVAYYGLLAGYALYEMIFGGEYISIIVVAPLFYTFLTMAGLLLIFPIFDLFQVLFGGKRFNRYGEIHELNDFGQYMRSSLTSIIMALIFIGIAIGLVLINVDSAERTTVFEPVAWLIFLFTFIDILLRTFIFNRQEDQYHSEDWKKKLFRAYPIGKAAFIILGIGPVVLLHVIFFSFGFASDPQSYPYLIFLFFFPSITLFVLAFGRLQKMLKDPSLLIPIGILLIVVLSLFLYGLFLVFLRALTSPLGLKAFLAVFFPPYYGYLAWLRWKENRVLQQQRSGVPS
jgi:hypothetical protein